MIHPNALVHPEAQIDPSVEIGPFCTVGAQVKIGKGCRLVSHVVVDGWTELGENNTVFPFAVLGGVPQDLKYKGEQTRLIVGNDNTFRESVTVNLGTQGGGGITRIGDRNLFMAYAHLGHDAIVGNNCILANCAAIAGHVQLEDWAILGGLTAVAQFVRIGMHTYIGGHSGIEKDVPPYSAVVGSRPKSLKGANIVGLRRRGLSSETVQAINESIKLWCRQEIEAETCLRDIEAQYGRFPEVQHFVSFIRKSETGVVR